MAGTFVGGACGTVPFGRGTVCIGKEYLERSKGNLPIKEKEGIPADVSFSLYLHIGKGKIIGSVVPSRNLKLKNGDFMIRGKYGKGFGLRF